MNPMQEPKYEGIVFENGDEWAMPPDAEVMLVNRETHEPIPFEEPVFIFRARDRWALAALAHYQGLCDNAQHKQIVEQRMRDFEEFASAYPERIKEPD